MRHHPAQFLLILTLAIIAIMAGTDTRISISRDEAIARELRISTSSSELQTHINRALGTGDRKAALMFVQIARMIGREVPANARNLASDGEVPADYRTLLPAIRTLTGHSLADAFETRLTIFAFLNEHIGAFMLWLMLLGALGTANKMFRARAGT